jgi:hypothetical protein
MTEDVIPDRRILAMKMSLLPLLVFMSGCATAVYNPEKGREEAQADIDACKEEANRRYYWDRVAALNLANECLEGKGYRRSPAGSGSTHQERERDTTRPKPPPGQPCEIPC